jgi:hypothetical protein
VAYRGRLMLELEMTPDKLPEESDKEKSLTMDKKLEDRLTVSGSVFALLCMYYLSLRS